jgi:hypothetical protein
MSPPRPTPSPTALLWASAFVLAGLIVVQLGRSDTATGGRGSGAALAAAMSMPDGVSRVGDYTAMTFNAGSDEVLAVLDGRGEELFLYRVKNMNDFEFLGRDSLPSVFATARKIGPGKK